MAANKQILNKQIQKEMIQELEDFKSFHQKTDIYNLTVTFVGGNLFIKLQDLVQWVEYEKMYLDYDVGKEIHRKMDVIDVFSAFSESKTTGKKGQVCETRRRSYSYGQIVKKQGTPCYKIEKRGKVTVYWAIIDKRLKQEVIYESNLYLTKNKNMTQTDLLVQNIQIEKRVMMQQFKLRKQERSKQKQLLLIRIQLLETEELEMLEQIQKELKIKNIQIYDLIAKEQKNLKRSQSLNDLIQIEAQDRRKKQRQKMNDLIQYEIMMRQKLFESASRSSSLRLSQSKFILGDELRQKEEKQYKQKFDRHQLQILKKQARKDELQDLIRKRRQEKFNDKIDKVRPSLIHKPAYQSIILK